ncbi:tripartite tricarboxylate transporter permease [Sporosarcina thermotolerans]|uniref:Tripartite tricarboxylate transporter permease n=1 Tax=Sporosarcina thermotolerans TaxID=633404 RepID=A0AAW9A4X1_9BACL|nr:tripartite tricarboxylate transporter permease [Sporosarcina thermotolerans]MDW0116162.1 tripartite tricarboxylate transporter permease [Sporosarcina thermotolerans]
MEEMLTGLLNVMSFSNLFFIAVGMTLGIFIGSMPGLSATMGIAILLPLTYGMDPATGIAMLAALYMGASYGGSITAVLINTPGTPAAAATVLDGYPMSQNGEAGKALGISLVSSFIGGVAGAIVLLTIAPFLGEVALKIGVVELFAIAVLGITIISSLSTGSVIKGLLSGTLGLLISLIGMDAITGTPRFTFGSIYLFDGISFVVALIGLFSIPQALKLIERDTQEIKVSKINDKILPSWKEIFRLRYTLLRSSVIGVIVGLIPGTGGDTASWFSYNEAKRFSKEKEKFGTGHAEGVAAPESANNAVVGGALVPTITLGVPGSSSTAVLLGGLMIHGIMPGPTLMTEHADVAYTLLWAVLISCFFMLGLGILYTRVAVGVTKVPPKVLAPIIILLCVIGTFAVHNSMVDVMIMFGFGIAGYFMDKLKIPVAPMVVGLILGIMLDTTMNQSLKIGRGDWMIFLSKPVAAILLFIALITILQSTPLFGKLKSLIKR